jgi:hypothetical protein
MSGGAAERTLAGLAGRVRRRAALATVSGGVGVAMASFALVGWSLRHGWVTGPWWVLAAWSAGLIVLGGVVAVLVGVARATTPRRAAWLLEEGAGWRRGSLSQLLQKRSRGTSDALLTAADRAAAAALAERGRASLDQATARWRPRLRAAAVLGVLGTAAFVSGHPLDGPGRALWRPARALRAALAPVRVSLSAATVGRGDSVTIAVTADERRSATLWLRAPGEEWRARPLSLDSAGHAEVVTPPLTGDLYVHATSGGRGSDTLVVRVRLPAFLGAVTVTAHYPGYLRLDPEPLPLDGDTVLLPAGTRLVTAGEATAPLGRGAWLAPGGTSEPLRIDGARFGASFVPRSSGSYRLELATADGGALEGAAMQLPLRIVEDAPPEVTLPVPGADTAVGADLRVPLVVEARDDHGLSRLWILFRRAGTMAPALDSLPLPAGGPDHVVVPWTLDLTGRGFLPGDTVLVRARALDNAPTPHAADSHEYRVRLATLSEVRAATGAASDAVARGLDSANAASAAAGRRLEDLALERTRAASAPNGEALGYEAAERTAAAAREQRGLQDQVAKLRDAVGALERQAAAAGLDDPQWRAQLDQIRQELDRALTPEMRQQLDALEQATRDLDATRAAQALRDLSASQGALRDALARSRELFRRAAVEGDLANLGAEARELVSRQESWNQALTAGARPAAGREERTLAGRTDSLAAGLEQLAAGLSSDGRDSAVKDAARRARSAAAAMRDAADAADRAQAGPAAEAGKAAAERLSPVPQALEDQKQGLQQEWRADVTAELDRALAETARLSGAELALSGAFGAGTPAASLRERQAALEEGTARVVEQLRDASGKNALVSPQLAVAMTQALMQMGQARSALGSAVPDLRSGAERAGQAVDALNAAAYFLLRNRDEVAGSKSGSGLAEAMAKMRELAGEQGTLGEASAGILPLPGGGSAAQIRALGGRQRAIADQLERMRGQGEVPGAGELAAEAKALARSLEEGRLDRATVERQQRLFHRMLDAGRTLQGNDEDPSRPRVSRTATDDSTHLPPPLPAGALDRGPRMPPWSDLERYTPEERRLVAGYFQRLIGGTR